MVRLGGVLYGLEGDVLPASIPRPELRPVMSLRSKIAHIKKVPAGETLGYGRTFETSRSSIIATIPVGYEDGYRRILSNDSKVIVNGEFPPVVGRISMDWTIIDVTDIAEPKVGDVATLVGHDGGLSITAEEIAGRCSTISYEITCGINRRVAKVFKGSP